MDHRRGSSPIVPNAKTDACASPPPVVTAPVEPWQKGNWRGFERVVHRGLMNKSRHGTIMRDLHPSHLIHSLTTCSDVVLASGSIRYGMGKQSPNFPKRKTSISRLHRFKNYEYSKKNYGDQKIKCVRRRSFEKPRASQVAKSRESTCARENYGKKGLFLGFFPFRTRGLGAGPMIGARR